MACWCRRRIRSRPQPPSGEWRKTRQDPNLARQFSAAARSQVEIRFSLQAMLDRTEQLGAELLAEKRR